MTAARNSLYISFHRAFMGLFDTWYMLIGCNTTIIWAKSEKKSFFILRVYINLYFWALLQLSVGHSEPEFLTFNLNNAQL